MGLAYNVYLNSHKIYGCKNCKAHLSNHEDIISRVRRLLAISTLRNASSSPNGFKNIYYDKGDFTMADCANCRISAASTARPTSSTTLSM